MKCLADVTILIPTRYNSRYIIELCLLCINKYVSIPFEIIIGDAGVDYETREFLDKIDKVQVVRCPDPLRPKDFLARKVKSPYFLFLHDDAHFFKTGWLELQLEYMKCNNNVGFSGVIGPNYISKYKSIFSFCSLHKRFFPLGFMVRTQTQHELDIFWGKIKGFDTGAIAYQQYKLQDKWKFKKYRFDKAIKHWGGMTWPVRKLNGGDQTELNLNNLIDIRKERISLMKNIISTGKF